MKNDKGFTLVEILASLTILGIVFIGFMTVFPQMTKFNEKTEDKLISMNLAKKELAEWQLRTYSWNEFEQYSEEKIDGETVKRIPGFEDNAEIILYKKEDLEKNQHEESVSLHKVHINLKENGKIISETFGYIKVR